MASTTLMMRRRVTSEAEREERRGGYRVQRGIAMLPVRGVLVRRAGQITSDSTPLQSYEGIRRSLRVARNDRRVRGILMELDTPGGEAGGIFELADEVRATSRDKPVWAVANDDALSAGYAIAAAAQKLWITNTGAAGSLGVIALHIDQSRFDEQEGCKFTYIARGAHKTDANPHAPLTPQAIGVIQGEVDRLYDMLIDSVAGHRAASPERLRATEAGVYFGGNAVSEGLADQLGTLDQAHAAMMTEIGVISSRQMTAVAETRFATQSLDRLQSEIGTIIKASPKGEQTWKTSKTPARRNSSRPKTTWSHSASPRRWSRQPRSRRSARVRAIPRWRANSSRAKHRWRPSARWFSNARRPTRPGCRSRRLTRRSARRVNLRSCVRRLTRALAIRHGRTVLRGFMLHMSRSRLNEPASAVITINSISDQAPGMLVVSGTVTHAVGSQLEAALVIGGAAGAFTACSGSNSWATSKTVAPGVQLVRVRVTRTPTNSVDSNTFTIV